MTLYFNQKGYEIVHTDIFSLSAVLS